MKNTSQGSQFRCTTSPFLSDDQLIQEINESGSSAKGARRQLIHYDYETFQVLDHDPNVPKGKAPFKAISKDVTAR